MKFILTICFALLFILPACRDKEPEKFPPKPDERLPNIPVPPAIPVKKLSFAIQYKGPLNFEFCKRDVVFLDMFDYSKKDVTKCKKMGAIVYAYFSSQYENWRPDSKEFLKQPNILGNKLDKWPGEKWVNTKSTKVREIMINRIIYAKEKGFQGIDVDNVDGYHFKTGYIYRKIDSANYVNFFIRTARKFDLKFSLKNAMALIPLTESADFYQNESCYSNNHKGRIECYLYDAVKAPVGIISYVKFLWSCPKNLYEKAYTILKKSLNHKDKICN